MPDLGRAYPSLLSSTHFYHAPFVMTMSVRTAEISLILSSKTFYDDVPLTTECGETKRSLTRLTLERASIWRGRIGRVEPMRDFYRFGVALHPFTDISHEKDGIPTCYKLRPRMIGKNM